MFDLKSRTYRWGGVVLALLVAGCASAPEEPEPEPAPAADTAADEHAAMVERGGYLVQSIAGCGNCHSPRDDAGEFIEGMELAGAYVIADPGFTAYAPNITPDETTGIGSWTEAQIARAVREGVHPDGHILGPPMSFTFYRGISDHDVQSIAAYLKTVPAVVNDVPRSEYNIPLPEAWGPPVGTVPDVSPDDPVAYGAYLAGPVGHCIDCHTPLVDGQLQLDRVGEGGNVYERPFGLQIATISSNITSSEEDGIGAWTDDEIKRAITEGVSRDGRRLARFMGFSFYQNIRDEDLDAIVAYLRTLPPLP